jgi:hypothetical protein
MGLQRRAGPATPLDAEGPHSFPGVVLPVEYPVRLQARVIEG